MAVYEIKPVADLDPEYVETQIGHAASADTPFALLRNSEIKGRVILWSLHKSEKVAKAAKRRAERREIVTR